MSKLEEDKAAFQEIVKMIEEMDLLNIPLNDVPSVYKTHTPNWQFSMMRRYLNTKLSSHRERLLK